MRTHTYIHAYIHTHVYAYTHTHLRQSADLSHMLRGVDAESESHVIIIEDDQMLCPNAMLSLQYLIRKAYTYAPGW